jgi:lysozyme
MTCMTVSDAGIKKLHDRESCRLVAYLDSVGVWTIGWGTIRYPDGRKVKKGDTVTQGQADDYFRYDLKRFELAVDALTTDTIVQRQFDALVSFTYNVGEEGYRGSSVRRLVNANPADPTIRERMMLWCRGQLDDDPYKERIEGLWNRRHSEADQYFGVTTPRQPFPGP